jgi:hypothetical protein
MPGSCPYTKINGEPCGRPVGSFELCGHHRERAASKPSRPCAGCGVPTKRDGGLCIRRSCGWNEYMRSRHARKKAAAAEELAAQDATEENQRRAEENQRRTEETFEELAAALAGLAPWPEWVGVTAEEFEAAGEREAERQEADKAAQRAQQAEAAAALDAVLEALRAAEAEAAAAADRDRAAREQLDRLRRAYAACAATRLGSLVPAGAALAR